MVSVFLIKMTFVTDYVYFESSTNSPYHIRRIEELTKVVFPMMCIQLFFFFLLSTNNFLIVDTERKCGSESHVLFSPTRSS